MVYIIAKLFSCVIIILKRSLNILAAKIPVYGRKKLLVWMWVLFNDNEAFGLIQFQHRARWKLIYLQPRGNIHQYSVDLFTTGNLIDLEEVCRGFADLFTAGMYC